ncbi:MAG: chromosome segregation protein SMC [Firmicutes bacterium]|nr:chromosome segregation protein SMC [Bacillota bacterium]
MLLRRIEIVGFKSFADRISLELGPGVTAIVGPNGTGKSNLADAVRWALGEANPRQLRGLRMEDMIFGGSESRRPLSMAEVSLTFDNSDGLLPLDFSEVTVTRRVYRDGSGEYFINRTPCRLRDVQELFYDTGIARDGYSLVGQGRVDEILSARPEERRLLLEEAAGIVRARQRRREALARLEASARDLERLGDVMAELELQMQPLAEEARRAGQWEEYRRQRDAALLILTWRERAEVEQALAAARARVASLEEALRGEQEKAARLEASHASLAQEERMYQEERRRLQEELLGLADRVSEAGREVARWEERVGSLEAEVSRLEREEADVAARLEAASTRCREAATARQAWEATWGEVARRLEEKRRTLAGRAEAVRRLATHLEAKKEELIDLLGKIAAARNRQVALESEARQLGESLRRVAERRAQLEEALRRTEEDLLVLAEQDKRAGARRSGLEEERGRLEAEREAARARRDEQEAALRRAEAEFHQVTSRLQALRELEESLAGFARGPKALLEAKRRDPAAHAGVVGPVSALLDVPGEYETALEVALGAAVQDIVVKTVEDARRAIEFLKRTQAGWATFLPLDSLRPTPLGPGEKAALRREGILGVAADLVSFLPEHRPAVEYLLGRTVVARDLPAALGYARAVGFRVRVVTLEGDVVFPGGSLAGGWRRGTRTGMLGRAREIARLEDRAGRLEALLADGRRAVQEAAREEAARAAHLERIREEFRALDMYLAGLQKERQARMAERDRLAQELAGLQLEESMAASRRDELEEEMRTREEQVAGLEGARQALEGAVASLTAKLEQVQERERALAEEEVALRLRLAGQEEQRVRLEEAASRAEEEVATLERARAALAENLAARGRDLEEARSRCVRWRETLASRSAEHDRVRERMERLTAEGERLVRRLASVERGRRQVERRLAETREALHAARLEEVRLGLRLEELDRNLASRFGCTPARAEEQVGADPLAQLDTGALGEKVQEMEARMAELEPVNLAAAGEYARLKERHGFLSDQRRDLEEGRHKLGQVIRELEREMAEKFTETFARVRERFSTTFTQMFGGGRADLLLVGSDPLEAGVEVVAQPPGKKLQHLSLLSGGERTLCAIALLFALLETRPSRFCLFDEVDATLDEANVDRFARFLRELSPAGQFLVVTHQKGTMEVADVLYGTTMEESGVSRVVSLRLEPA